ncbi:MFS transporter [Propionibacteriaceae bacterium Y1923]
MGWAATTAGIVVAVSQFTGAAGRIVIGALSDRVGTRVRVMRVVAMAGIGSMLLLGLAGASHWAPAAAVMLIIASTISVADNGLAYTSVAEAAGPSWAGKALGLQNTGQYLVAAAVGPVVGALIGLVGYPIAFALVGVAPLASLGLVPDRDQHWDVPDDQPPRPV